VHAELDAMLRDALELELAPVAIAFLDAAPDGIDRVDTATPAGCGFWRLARDRVFYTEAADHAGCPIGVLTMGLEADPDVQEQAGELVARMESIAYLQPGEAASLPSVRPGPAVVAYGPLQRFPLEPDVVLVTSTPEQAMWLAEAAGAVQMNGPALHLHGRPACAAIPRALESTRLELSLGCAGMRTFTAIEPGMLLSVLPAPALAGLGERLRSAAAANETMRAAYAEKLA
jgi:uncharacterized protein (DUF169 family)